MGGVHDFYVSRYILPFDATRYTLQTACFNIFLIIYMFHESLYFLEILRASRIRIVSVSCAFFRNRIVLMPTGYLFHFANVIQFKCARNAGRRSLRRIRRPPRRRGLSLARTARGCR